MSGMGEGEQGREKRQTGSSLKEGFVNFGKDYPETGLALLQ